MSGFKQYTTPEARVLAIRAALLEGANYIVEYRDVDPHPYGLNVATVDWVPEDKIWVDPEVSGGGRYINRSDLSFGGSS
jgi:hypothetical protein